MAGNSIKNYFNVETREERAARQAPLCVEDSQGTEQADSKTEADDDESQLHEAEANELPESPCECPCFI